MEVIATQLPGVVIIRPEVFGDSRGYFFESFSVRRYDSLTGKDGFVQDNESKSCRGVVRGLHYQKGSFAQAKLVRVVQGCVRDVAVDLRVGSPSFGKSVAVDLSGENHLQLYIPRGFAHGFSVLSETAVFQYKCDNYYEPSAEAGIAWNDPDLGIDWGLDTDSAILSPKDTARPRLKDVPVEELFIY